MVKKSKFRKNQSKYSWYFSIKDIMIESVRLIKTTENF